MPTLSQYAPNLLDLTRRLDPDGKIADIVEAMDQQNEALTFIPWIEANLPTGHKTTIRTGLPAATWRQLNYGVQPSKSTTKQVTDSIGMLENYSKIDKSLLALNGNSAEFRLSEDMAFIEGMNQDFMKTFIYGDVTTNPERFTGIAPRYSQKAGMAADTSGDNIILGGGAGATNTSVYLVVFGANTVHGIYPKGSKAGLESNDLGESTLTDANGGEYQGVRTHYKWDSGIVVRDWRYIVRVANIDVSALTKNASAGADLIDLMAQALETVQDLTKGKPVFLMNKTIRSFLRRQMMNKSNACLTLEQLAGRSVLHFDGVPCAKVDAILNTESAIA